ncbi:ROK family transcriptional regulator [Rathayibacter sp. Leaf248]|uniref:ROK family transcriptional regulator n=1 Tax=Rathayibacter sp. Leaf248 TaxID=2876555 RepID=UPI001E30FB58|nr:ROK family protein [Rathayibacter sp. Leaf248]
MATTRAPRSPATSRGVLLDLVRARGPISRVELAQVTGLTQATVSILVRQLLADGLVADAGRSESTGGKPRELLALVPSARVALGLQLEADSTTAIVADLAGSVVGRLRTRGVLDEGPESFVRGFAERIDLLIEALGVERERVVGVGVVTPGGVDRSGERVVGLPGPQGAEWAAAGLRSLLEEACALPVLLDDDASAAAVGEFWAGTFPAAGAHCTLYLAGGIRAGLVLDGALHRGSGAGAGRLDRFGPRGSAPLAERVGLPGIAAAARAARLPGLSGDAFADAAAVATAAVGGDPASAAVVDAAAHELADVAVALADLLDLDSVVLAGPAFAVAGSRHLAVLRARFADEHPGSRVLLSAHVADAAAVGAAALVLQRALSPRGPARGPLEGSGPIGADLGYGGPREGE